MNTTNGDRFWRCDTCGELNTDGGKELCDGDIVFCSHCGETSIVMGEEELEVDAE